MKFRSKVDVWLALVAGAALLFCMYSAVGDMRSRSAWLLPAALLLVAVGLPAWIFLSTYYLVAQQKILVKSGPFRWVIPIESIVGMTPSNSLLSSPALSLDRLRIDYDLNGRKYLLVSPADKEGFRAAVEAARA